MQDREHPLVREPHDRLFHRSGKVIRPFRPDDLETLQMITVICFEGVSIDHNIDRLLGRFSDRDWKARKSAHIAEDVALNPRGVFVAEEQGRVVGYITTRLDRDARIGHIPNLSVLPEYRQRGIAAALMKEALDYFEAEGMAVARIETLEQNPIGQTFYPSAGFQEVARQIHYAMRLSDRRL